MVEVIGGLRTCGMGVSGRVYCTDGAPMSGEFQEVELPMPAAGLDAQHGWYDLALLRDGEVWGGLNGFALLVSPGLRANPEHGSDAISTDDDQDLCLIAENGRVRCGPVLPLFANPPSTSGFVELDIGGPATQVEISSGGHGCALRSDGAVVCWSSGSYSSSSTSTWTVQLGEPAAEIGYGNRIGWGSGFGCARLQGGDVKCWGNGEGGVLGRGDISSVDSKSDLSAMAPVDLGGRAVGLSTGRGHSCALLEDDSLRCWGSGGAWLDYGVNDYVGDSETPDAFPPLDVGGAISDLSLSEHRSCALLASGELRCWGAAEKAALLEQLPWGLPLEYPTIEFDEPVATISTTDHFSACAVLSSGELHCWGQDGGSKGRTFAQPVVQTDAFSHIAYVTGGDRTVETRCVVLEDGEMRCWSGWAFDANFSGSDMATEWEQGVGLDAEVSDIAVGADFFCAIVSDGAVRCGGRNNSGQLGYGNTVDVSDDAALKAAGDVALGERALQIEAGDSFVCARLESGVLTCWGENSRDEVAAGQLGYGHTNTIGDDETPASAGSLDFGGALVSDFCVGKDHGCALLEGGEVACWGRNEAGQLGYGHTETIGDDETAATAGPVPVGGQATDVFCGSSLSCALLRNGDLRCWGDNHSGALGMRSIGIIGDDETPAQAGPVPYE